MPPIYRPNILNKLTLSSDGYAYVNAPKCACSAVRRSLVNLEMGKGNLDPLDEYEIRRCLHSPTYPLSFERKKGDWNGKELFFFTIVRNPYARALSAYIEKFVRERPYAIPEVEAFEARYGVSSKGMSFIDFLRIIGSDVPELLDPHWQPLHIVLGAGLVNYGAVGKLEAMDQIESTLKTRLSNQFEFAKHSGHNTGSTHQLGNYYTAEAIELVNSLYEKDFELFGYTVNDLDDLHGQPVEMPGLRGPRQTFLQEYLRVKAVEQEANRLAESLIKLGDMYKQPHCYIEAGMHYESLGMLDEAEAAYNQANQLNGNLPTPHFRLSQIYVDRPGVDAAIEEARVALALVPENVAIREHLVSLLESTGCAEEVAEVKRTGRLHMAGASHRQL